MIQVPDEIKELLKQGSVRKNFRVKFPNGDHTDLTNKDIISESVSFTESLCSQDELKFGLCEANTISFETFNVGNIKGKTIDCQIEIDCTGLDASFIEDNCTTPEDLDYPVYSIAYGRFEVDSCVRDSGNLQRRKVDAFSIESSLNLTLNKFEAFKQQTPVATSNDYTEMIDKYIFQHLFPKLSDVPDYIERTSVRLENIQQTSTYALTTNIGIKGPTFHTNPETQYTGYLPVENNLYINVAIEGYWEVYDVDNIAIAFNELPHISIDSRAVANTAYTYYHYLTDDPYGPISYNQTILSILTAGMGYDWVYDKQTFDVHDINSPYSVNPILYTSVGKTDNNEVLTKLELKQDELYELSNLGGNVYIKVWIPRGIEYTLYISSSSPETYRKYYNLTEMAHQYPYKTVMQDSSMRQYLFDSKGAEMHLKRVKLSNRLYVADKDTNNRRSLLEGLCELKGVFGRIDRQTNIFETVDINRYLGVYPSDDLFPSNDLYPNGGNGEGIQLYDMSMYSKAWYDDLPTKRYSAVTCTYQNGDSEEVVETYTIVDTSDSSIFNPDNYQVYDLSDNEIIKDSQLSQSQIQSILQTVAGNIRYVQYMPADVDCVGLPYVESGDVADIATSDGAFETIILRRTLNGIQALSDNIESKG